MSLGKRLRSARDKRGWTQEKASKEIGVPAQNISNYERDYREPDLPTLNKLADGYKVNVQWLITGENIEGTMNEPIEPDDRKRKLLEILDKMNDEQVEHILRTAEFIVSKD